MKRTASNECRRPVLAAWLGAAVLGLAACGGGGGGGTDAPVGNTGGGTTAPVAVAPTITAQPQALAVKDGATATFTVSAAGDGPLAFRWQRNGVDIEGATAASHSFQPSQTNDDQAVFTVRVSNAAGSVTSQPARLTVRSALADTLGLLAGDVTLAKVGSLNGTGSQATFQWINGIVADGQGNVYVAEPKMVRKIAPDGAVTMVAWSTGFVTMSAPDLRNVTDIALGPDGTLYMSDAENASVQKVGLDGLIGGAAGSWTSPGYQDGPLLTAKFTAPQSVAVDASGTLYVLDRSQLPSGTYALVVRKVQQGQVTTVPGGVIAAGNRGKLAVDAGGNILVAVNKIELGMCAFGGCQEGPGLAYILKISPSGEQSVLAGSNTQASLRSVDGTAGAARFVILHDIAVDASGDLYVTDSHKAGSVRKVTREGVVTTVVGSVQEYGDAYPKTITLGPLPGRVVTPNALALSPDGAALYVTSGRPSFLKGGAAYYMENLTAFDGTVVLKAVLK